MIDPTRPEELSALPGQQPSATTTEAASLQQPTTVPEVEALPTLENPPTDQDFSVLEAMAGNAADDGASSADSDDKQQAHSEVLRTDEYSEYLLHAPREVSALMLKVTEHGDLVTIYFNEGKDFLLTSLLQVNDTYIYLDKGSSPDMNRKALAAEKLFCVTRHAKVKLQFLLTGVEEVEVKGNKVFRAKLPETILRLQRREFYRLTTPITRPLICHVPMTFTDGRTEIIDISVVDISAGGVAMLAPPEGILFEEDMEFPNCSLELPEMGVVSATLRVCNIFEVTLRSGNRIKRSGCRFVNIPSPSQNMIQRYIIRIERERKARESGLA